MSTFTEANRQAFNDMASKYHSQAWQRAMTAQVREALQALRPWLGARWAPENTSRLLDYACGTGAITAALGPYVTEIRGMDISEAMVAEYNSTVATSGGADAKAIVGDLASKEIPDNAAIDTPEWRDFDIAVIGLGFHHFEAPGLAMARLVERLRPETGVLVIVDLLPSTEPAQGRPSGFPEMNHTIHQDGFSREQMQKYYEEAGYEAFDFKTLDEPAIMELNTGTVRRTLFVAKGQRKALKQ